MQLKAASECVNSELNVCSLSPGHVQNHRVRLKSEPSGERHLDTAANLL